MGFGGKPASGVPGFPDMVAQGGNKQPVVLAEFVPNCKPLKYMVTFCAGETGL